MTTLRPRTCARIGDLAGARSEAVIVARALREKSWTLTELAGESASRSSIEAALTSARLVHYAGHGIFAGRAGWSSALPLARGDAFTVADLLTLPRVPEWVVLSGCETARSAADVSPEGVGLAQAFLVVGARGVIASVREVQDALALRFSTLLYRELESGSADLAGPFHRAQRALARELPHSDWAAFRLLVSD